MPGIWTPGSSAELGPLIDGHYSRRRPWAPGQTLGGVGTRLLLKTPAGSAWISTLQGKGHWPCDWKDPPSWWVGVFRRHADDPHTASELIQEATEHMQGIAAAPAYTAIDPTKIRSTRRPGYTFARAGWTWHVCTRAMSKKRSLLIMRVGVKVP